MKISYLSNSELNKKAANAVHVMNMAESFSKNGHQVYLHAKFNGTDKKGLFSKYQVENIFKINTRPFFKIRFLGAILYGLLQAVNARFKVKPDICYCRCLLSCFFALNLGLKCVVEIHEMPHTHFFKWIYKYILSHKSTLKVVVISDALKQDLQEHFTNPKVTVAHDGASIKKNIKSFDLIKPKKINIGYAGGLRSGNGIGLILRLATQLSEYKFHIVGGSSEDILTWKSQQKSSNIHWYGRIDPSDVPGFLKECDILLAPYQEGPKTGAGRDTSKWMSPLKVFEYMASGTVFMVSDYPVLREVLSEDNSVLIKPNDFDSWVIKLKELSASAEIRKSLADKAFLDLETNYTWQKRAKKVIEGLSLNES